MDRAFNLFRVISRNMGRWYDISQLLHNQKIGGGVEIKGSLGLLSKLEAFLQPVGVYLV